MNNIDILQGKKIILGVTGGIAAYKSCLIVRELVKRGAEVRVIMTPSALEFITPLSLSTLSGNDVIVKSFPEKQNYGVNLRTWHIETALWADLMLIAPLTVNTLAKIANGFADNALTTLVQALRSPLVLAPAADLDMYNKEVFHENIEKCKSRGAVIVDAEEGFLASGLTGKGRMASIEKIIKGVELRLAGYKHDLEGKKVLVTAGPTYEDIDPVRFIGNRSTGKMGYEIAKAAYLRGAEVTLISGPSFEEPFPEFNFIKVRSALEMQEAISNNVDDRDAIIMSAAVADFRPAESRELKIKDKSGFNKIELVNNPDILASLKKRSEQIFIGFALETHDEKKNAKDKIKKKGLDFIVLNSLQNKDAGFEKDTNVISIIDKEGNITDYPVLSKFEAANKILDRIRIE